MDFPRGKLPPGSELKRRKRNAPADVLFKKSDAFNDGDKKKSKRRKKKTEDTNEDDSKVVIESVSMKRLPIGTTIIGCISKITDIEITMIIAGGGNIFVPIYNISDSYSELVEEFVLDPSSVTPFKPQSMFEIGQCLPVKILERTEEGKRKITKVIGSINPKDVYSEVHPLSLKSFASNIVISAAVKGIEDHGYIMDIGLGDQMNGFLAASDAKDYLKRHPQMNRIPVGCVLLCAGVSITSRVLKLTTKTGMVRQNIVTGESDVLPLASVIPGLKVSVRVMDITERGLEVIAANEHKGYIHRDHLKSEWDVPDKNYSIASVLEARVLYVHPVSQLVICSLRDLPDPSSIGTKFAGMTPGKVIVNSKVALYDERGNMILVTKENKIKLLASKNNISDEQMDETKVIQDYPIGSKQKCKVLSVNYLDQLVRVTLKPSYVNEECLSHEDVSVGTIITGKVKNLTESGMYLKLGPRLNGFVRNVHFADAPQVVHPEKMFPLDKEVKCRILKIDADAEPPLITVTCKKSLVSSKFNLLDSIEKAVPGFETLGVVVLANQSGVLLEFFGGLQGWISRILLTDYVSIETSFTPGQIVKCYVISSDTVTGRINLSLNKCDPTEQTQEVTKHIPEAPIQKRKEGEPAVGQTSSAKVIEIGEDGLVLQFSNGISATVPLTHVIDSQYINKRELERRFKVNQEVKCRIISRYNEEIQVTMKPALLDHSVTVWRNFPTLQVGMSNLGFISKIVGKQGRLVTFVGGARGFLKEKLIVNNSHGYKAGKLQPGTLVACSIINIDPAAKKLTLDLFPIDSFKSQSVGDDTPVTTGFSFGKSDELRDADDEELNAEENSIEKEIETKVKSLRESEKKFRKKESNRVLNADEVDVFEKRVSDEPNSCNGWIEYMTYQLECNHVDDARKIGERALKTINFREENDRFNIWVALINLEHFYGDRESLDKVIERAREVNDPIKINLRIAKMYQDGDETELAEQIYESMMKKSKNDKSYWVEYGMFLMKIKRFESARNLMKKSLDSLPNREHLDVICKFAQMEFKSGQIEQGKTLFENVLINYPKRTDIWIVYISMLMKHAINHDMPTSDELEAVRTVFERILAIGLNSKKVASVFKKYIEFEETYGNATRVEAVKDKSVTYVESNKLQPFME